jgi:hypothetical protein
MAEYTFTGASGSSGWIDLRGNTEPLGFAVVFSGVGTIQLQVSDEEAEVKTRTQTLATYTASSGRKLLPRYAGSFLRAIFTAWTSGTGYLQIVPAKNAEGRLYPLSVQSTVD